MHSKAYEAVSNCIKGIQKVLYHWIKNIVVKNLSDMFSIFLMKVLFNLICSAMLWMMGLNQAFHWLFKSNSWVQILTGVVFIVFADSENPIGPDFPLCLRKSSKGNPILVDQDRFEYRIAKRSPIWSKSQSWRCTKDGCKARITTAGDQHQIVKRLNLHTCNKHWEGILGWKILPNSKF